MPPALFFTMLSSILVYSKESPSNTIRMIQGHSGKVYGHARFNPTTNRMEFRFKPEEFTQAMAEDIVANMHRSFCKWVFWPEMDAATVAQADLQEEKQEDQSPATDSSPLNALPHPTDEDAHPVPASESNIDPYEGKGFRQLRALAKERGVPNVELITKSADLIAAMKDLEG